LRKGFAGGQISVVEWISNYKFRPPQPTSTVRLLKQLGPLLIGSLGVPPQRIGNIVAGKRAITAIRISGFADILG
jgi:hypothetical protein